MKAKKILKIALLVVVAGIAMANPIEVAKRTIVPCFIGVIILAMIIV